ncbi:ATP-binding protein [Bacteroides sp.]
MKQLLFILFLSVASIPTCNAINEAEDSLLWKDAEQKMESGQYEEAARLYDSISTKTFSNYKEINTHKVEDMRKTYSIDELELENNKQQNHLLRMILIYLLGLIIVSVFCVIYLKHQKKKLFHSQNALQKAKEAVEESIRNKSLFLSNMSHEIRTPLNALSGFSDILTTPGIDEATRIQCNEIIQLNSRLLLNLINDVVDISCLDVSNMKFNLKTCDAVSLCRNVVNTLEGIKQTQAAILFESSLHSLEIVTDTLRLQQVLINILVNATKFTKEGAITLKLEKEDAKEMAVFSVTDTGCGIPLEKQDKIFKRFEKANEKVQGTGLGLSISQLIIKRLGGDIWIDSQYSNGARFIFTHPLNQGEKP